MQARGAACCQSRNSAQWIETSSSANIRLKKRIDTLASIAILDVSETDGQKGFVTSAKWSRHQNVLRHWKPRRNCAADSPHGRAQQMLNNVDDMWETRPSSHWVLGQPGQGTLQEEGVAGRLLLLHALHSNDDERSRNGSFVWSRCDRLAPGCSPFGPFLW